MSLANFAEHITRFCRTGELDPALPVDQKRLRVYLEHFRKKITQNLMRAYPLTHHLLQPQQWDEMVIQFLAQGECASPFFWTVPHAFLKFAKKNRYAEHLSIPYLEDLMDFEWLEIEMYMMPDHEPRVRQEFSLDEVLLLNPESRLVTYSYPVFEKKPLPRLMKEGSYFLFAFRHTENKEVHFISLSSFYFRVLELLKNEHLNGREVLTEAAKEFKLDSTQVLLRGEKFLIDLFNQRAM